MLRENPKRSTSEVFIVAATKYGFVTPSTVAGAAKDVTWINVGGGSAEALFTPTSEAIKAQRKHSTPRQGHVGRASEPN